MNTQAPATEERREHPQVREIFVRACELLAPIVAGNESIMTISSFAMTQMLLQNFPELSHGEAHIVIATVEKMHREDRIRKILNAS